MTGIANPEPVTLFSPCCDNASLSQQLTKGVSFSSRAPQRSAASPSRSARAISALAPRSPTNELHQLINPGADDRDCKPRTGDPLFSLLRQRFAVATTYQGSELFFKGSATLRCFALALCSRYFGARSALTHK